MEATICSAPDVPEVPARQATKLPDAGAEVPNRDRKRLQRAMFAGLTGAATGSLGTPNVMKPTLG